MLSKQKQENNVGKGFDRITFIYDAFARVLSFNQINKSQLAFLSQLKTQSTCLILGGGTGLFLKCLLEENENIHITYVDASAKMIQYARKRIMKSSSGNLNRITFIHASVESFVFEKYDVIVCNYFLDLFVHTYVEKLVVQFRESLNPNGLLYITDFDFPDTKHVSGWFVNIGIKVLYAFFKWSTNVTTTQIVNIRAIVLDDSFEQIYSKYFFNRILNSRIYKLKNGL